LRSAEIVVARISGVSRVVFLSACSPRRHSSVRAAAIRSWSIGLDNDRKPLEKHRLQTALKHVRGAMRGSVSKAKIQREFIRNLLVFELVSSLGEGPSPRKGQRP
jgi:hypothetical protein